jgi:dTDP-N-acetylfucosamine:lipid II N-acetylfucosaminyltransferase
MRIAHILENSKFTFLIINHFRNFSEILSIQKFYISTKVDTVDFSDQHDIVLMSNKLEEFEEDLNSYDFLLFHNIYNEIHIKILSKCTNNVVWLGWGFDYYSLINYEVLTDFTKSKVDEIYTSNFIKQILKKSIFYKKLKAYQQKIKSEQILRHKEKIKYFIPILESEKLLCDQHFSSKMKYINFKYPHNFLNENVGEITNFRNDIIIGNSESIINNHLEIMDILEGFNFENQNIIMPLSYNSDEKYKNFLKAKCSKSKLKYLLMEDFLQSEAYFKILSNCGYGIFNTTRQNALGNIAALISQGCKIFLRKENLLYDFFTSEGIKVLLIQEISQYELTNSLALDEKINNLNQIKRLFGKEATYERTESFLLELKSQL